MPPARRPPDTAPASSERKYLLERVGDAAVVQLYADGFRDLPLAEKTLIWHLYQAALAGRDIFYDQKHARSLEMRDVLEAIIAAPGIEPGTYAEILRYTKLFWINSGPYNNKSARKFVLTCTSEAFAAAAHAAAKAGATFPTANGETLDQLLARLNPMFFDPGRRPDGDGQDACGRHRYSSGERQQPVRGRLDEGPGRVSRAVPAEFPAREAERPDGGGGVSRRRALRRPDFGCHPASRSGDPLRNRTDGSSPPRPDQVLPDGQGQRP